MDTKLAPWGEQERLNWKIWLYNRNFKQENPTFSEVVVSPIHWFNATFKITAWPMKMWSMVYKQTYVLEIRYQLSYIKHSRSMDVWSFGWMLSSDYAERVNEIALKYIQQQGWMLNQHLNSWPEFQAIVTIKPVPKKKVRRRTRVQDQTASDMARILDMYGIEPRSI